MDKKIPEKIPEGDIYGKNYKIIKLYLHNIINMIIPASAISCKKNNSTLDIHNLNLHKKNFDNNNKDKSGSYVSKGTSIASYSDSNVAFGIGCRRCPGEEITLLYFYRKWKDKLYRIHQRFYFCGIGKVSWFEKLS